MLYFFNSINQSFTWVNEQVATFPQVLRACAGKYRGQGPIVELVNCSKLWTQRFGSVSRSAIRLTFQVVSIFVALVCSYSVHYASQAISRQSVP